MNVDIQSVRVNSTVNLCLDQKPVIAPHWVLDGQTPDSPGSYRPAAFLIPHAPTNFLEVELAFEQPDSSGPFTLEGTLGEHTFRSHDLLPQDRDPANGIVKVKAFPVETPVHFKQVQGDVKWVLKKENEPDIPLRETRLELYWLYNYPGKMFKKGAWVEVLRLLAKQCYRGLVSKEDIITRVVNYCHSGSGLRYDIADSTSHYTQAYWGGGFNLLAFLKNAYPLCICTDLAGLVQVLLGAIGLHVDYCYCHPFGFLNNTNLIGRGQVNNTYFLGREPASEVVKRFSKQRWGFGSHAFCTWDVSGSNMVLDACAGPHIGHETTEDYLNAVIDRHKELYPDPRESLKRPAEVTDIYNCTGITDVHSITCQAGDCEELQKDDERIQQFVKETGFDSLPSPPEGEPEKFVVQHWQDPCQCPAIGNSWTVNYHNVKGGCRSAVMEWSLVRDLENLKISIFATTSGQSATQKQVMDTIASSPLADIPFKRKEKDPLGQFHVSAHSKELWLFHNISFLVECHHSDIDLDPICSWLQDQAEAGVKDSLDGYRPRFTEQETDPQYIITKKGASQLLKVLVENSKSQHPYLVDYFIEKEILQISAETAPSQEDSDAHYSITIRALEAGLTDISIYLIDRQTLISSSGVRVYCEVDEDEESESQS